MPDKVFRNSTLAAMFFVVVSGIAAQDVLRDDAGWAANWLAFSSAAAPYLIMGMIVWATGILVKVIQENRPTDRE